MLEIAREVCAERFPDAAVAFAAGSHFRGEGTPHSDLDLVVVYPKLPAAYRTSFVHRSLPVEAFVHDPETLDWFFQEDIPSLANMVAEGVPLPPNELAEELQRRARNRLHEGPAAWSAEQLERARYALTDLADDLRSPRNPAELWATTARLSQALAEYFCRSRKAWPAQGKSIPRRLQQLDPAWAARYNDALAQVYLQRDPRALIDLCEEQGRLFEGYRQEAPAHWRRPRLTTERLELECWEASETALRFRLKQQGEVVGFANLTQIFRGPFRACYLGYGLDEGHRGKGYMTEALRVITRYAFEDFGLHRIMANYQPHNEASARVLERLGFVREGVAQDYLFVDGAWRQHVLTSLHGGGARGQ